MRLDPEVLLQYIPLFLRDGWQVNVHSIGEILYIRTNVESFEPV